jgi:hypothetical protein
MAAKPFDLTAEEVELVVKARAAKDAEAKAKAAAEETALGAAAAAAAAAAKAKADAEAAAKAFAEGNAALTSGLTEIASSIVKNVLAVRDALRKAQTMTMANFSNAHPRDMTEFAGHFAAALLAAGGRLPSSGNPWTLKHAVDAPSPSMDSSDISGARMTEKLTSYVLSALMAAERGPDVGELARAATIFVKHRMAAGAKAEIETLDRVIDAARLAKAVADAKGRNANLSQPTTSVRQVPAGHRPIVSRDVQLHEGESIIGDELPRVG